MKTDVKPCVSKCCEYFGTCVDDGISVSDISDCIIKGLQDTYLITGSSIKYLFDKKVRYLGATVGIFDVNKPSGGGAEKPYPFWDADDYVKNTITVIE